MLDENYNKYQNGIIDMINGHWFMNKHNNNHNHNEMEIDGIDNINNIKYNLIIVVFIFLLDRTIAIR